MKVIALLKKRFLRMWCVQKVISQGEAKSAQDICEEAEELYNYIREGVPYQAEWVKKES